MGGTNAHVILEEYTGQQKTGASTKHWHLLPLLAATSTALSSAAANLSDYLKENTGTNIADTAWTLAAGRIPLRHRRCVVADSAASAAQRLSEPNALYGIEGETDGGKRPIVFLFSGQGTQYPGMGVELYQAEPVFRDAMNTCSRLLGPVISNASLIDILYGNNAEISEIVNQTAISQLALFAFEYSMTRLLESYGIKPSALVGHSIGEYVAACEAGVFSLEDALGLVRERGKLMQSMPRGTMIAIPLAEQAIRDILPESLDLAVVNAPNISVISGALQEVESFEKQLEEQGIMFRRLQTSHAFHSRMMEPAAQAFTEIVRRVTRNAPQLPLASNLTGGWTTAEQVGDPKSWADHLRHTVRFADNLIAATQRFSSSILLEVGPGNTLCSIARQHADKVAGLPAISSVRHPNQRVPDEAFFLRALGAIWCHGAAIDLSVIYAGENRARVPLPAYPFERQPFWIGAKAHKKDEGRNLGLRWWHNSNGLRPWRIFSGKKADKRHQINEEDLIKIWSKVLGTSAIGADDNFFELGGHSLLAVSIITELEKSFGIRLPLASLIEAPTIAEFLHHIEKWKSGASS
jgi:acyl transferase domain-containing protein